MRPFFKHFGSKWRLTTRTPKPRYDTIVEPFAGAAGYSTRYGAGQRVLLFDTDPRVATIWRWLLAAAPRDVLNLPVTPLFDRADVRELGLEPGAMYLVQTWLSPQGKSSVYRMTPMLIRGRYTHSGSMWSEVTRARLAAQLPGIQSWRFEAASYEMSPAVEATWHIDPPYQGNLAGRGVYKTGPLDYSQLAIWCRTRRGQAMVHEQHGATWLPFQPLGTCVTGRDTDGRKTRRLEVWWQPQGTFEMASRQ